MLRSIVTQHVGSRDVLRIIHSWIVVVSFTQKAVRESRQANLACAQAPKVGQGEEKGERMFIVCGGRKLCG